MSLDSLIAIGMTFVIITGGFDLAVGSTFAFGGLIVGLLLQSGWGVVPAIGASVCAGVGIGLFNGVLPPTFGECLAAVGGMSFVSGLVKQIEGAVGEPPEIREDSYYFLWKMKTIGAKAKEKS